MEKLAGGITFHHVRASGPHLHPGVSSFIITKMNTIWPSARYPPTQCFSSCPAAWGVSCVRESEARRQQGLNHLSCRSLLQMGSWAQRLWPGGEPLPPAGHSNSTKCFHSTVYSIFTAR